MLPLLDDSHPLLVVLQILMDPTERHAECFELNTDAGQGFEKAVDTFVVWQGNGPYARTQSQLVSPWLVMSAGWELSSCW